MFVAVAIFAAAVLPEACAPRQANTTQSSAKVEDSKEARAHTVKKLVRGNPKDLVIQQQDLPGQFVLGGGEAKGTAEYSQVFVNPEAYLARGQGGAGLLGVITNLTLLNEPSAAVAQFTAQGGLDAESVLKNIRNATPGAVPQGVTSHDVQVAGADRVLCFRVHYILQGAPVYEYRYRVLVGNAVGNLIISALGTKAGTEPASLKQQAEDIAERQVARLEAGRG